VTDGVKFECYLNLVPGALFWFAPLQRNRTRSPSRKVGASASSMSAIGPKQTSLVALHMSAFGGKADIAIAVNVKSRKYKERCSENA
jgi:hypothetical protein